MAKEVKTKAQPQPQAEAPYPQEAKTAPSPEEANSNDELPEGIVAKVLEKIGFQVENKELSNEEQQEQFVIQWVKSSLNAEMNDKRRQMQFMDSVAKGYIANQVVVSTDEAQLAEAYEKIAQNAYNQVAMTVLKVRYAFFEAYLELDEAEVGPEELAEPAEQA